MGSDFPAIPREAFYKIPSAVSNSSWKPIEFRSFHISKYFPPTASIDRVANKKKKSELDKISVTIHFYWSYSSLLPPFYLPHPKHLLCCNDLWLSPSSSSSSSSSSLALYSKKQLVGVKFVSFSIQFPSRSWI